MTSNFGFIHHFFSDAKLIKVLLYGNIYCNSLSIDLTSHTVKLNNEPLKLTSTEYALLTLLAKNEGKVLTHQFILRQIWGPGYTEQSQYLRVFIGQLRKKIEANPNDPRFIATESGIGYRFCAKAME